MGVQHSKEGKASTANSPSNARAKRSGADKRFAVEASASSLQVKEDATAGRRKSDGAVIPGNLRISESNISSRPRSVAWKDSNSSAAALGSVISTDGVTTSSTGSFDLAATQEAEARTMVGFQALTKFQKRLLVKTWPHVHRAGSGGIGKVAISKFLAKKPRCRLLFQKAGAVQVFGPSSAAGLQEHYKWLTDLLDQAVHNVDRLEQVGQTCVEFGIKHSHMTKHGFEKDLWDVFGQMLLESITQLDTVRKHRELMKAWTVLTSFIIDKLRQGYEMGIRCPALQQNPREDNESIASTNGTDHHRRESPPEMTSLAAVDIRARSSSASRSYH